MNFLNMAANRLTEKFDPNSAGFGRGGVIGSIRNGDGMMGGGGGMQAPGIENADAGRAQEQMARSRGFQSYAQMMDWARQRNQQRETQTVGKGEAPAVGASPGAGQVMGANPAMLHPKNMFNRITDMLNWATGQ